MLQPDEQLPQQFEALIRRLAETQQLNIVAEIASLEPTVHALFDAHMANPDRGYAGDFFFNHVHQLWLGFLCLRQYDAAEQLWQEAVACARRWEMTHPPHLVHKGSAFYWWGGTAFLRRDVRKGFLLIHAALEEDRRKHHRQDEDPDTPALKFVTLDARTDTQYFRDLVQIGTNELEQRLAAYRASTGSSLQFADFQTNYARQFAIREIVFIFTTAVLEAINLRDNFQQIGAGAEFGAQLAANCLFDLCQVVEESIRVKSGNTGEFYHQAIYLSKMYGWSRDGKHLGDLNKQQKQNFERTIRALLKNTATADGRRPASSIERDLWLSYVVRNSTAHSLTSKLVLQEQFDTLYQSLLNTLFAVVDKVYP